MSFENPFSKKPTPPASPKQQKPGFAQFQQMYAAGAKNIKDKPFVPPPKPRPSPSRQAEERPAQATEQRPPEPQKRPRLMREEPTVEEMLIHGPHWRPSVEDWLARPEDFRIEEDDEPRKK